MIAIVAVVIVVVAIYGSIGYNQQQRAISCAEEVIGDSSFNVAASKISSNSGYPTYQVTGYSYPSNGVKIVWGVKIVLKEGSYYSYYDIQTTNAN